MAYLHRDISARGCHHQSKAIHDFQQQREGVTTVTFQMHHPHLETSDQAGFSVLNTHTHTHTYIEMDTNMHMHIVGHMPHSGSSGGQ